MKMVFRVPVIWSFPSIPIGLLIVAEAGGNWPRTRSGEGIFVRSVGMSDLSRNVPSTASGLPSDEHLVVPFGEP